MAIAIPAYFDSIREAKRNTHLYNIKLIKEALEIYHFKNKAYPQDAWSFTTYLLHNLFYFSKPRTCPYNNQPYKAIQWQPDYIYWDEIENWIEASNNYHHLYYKAENPSYRYFLTYYSR